MVGPREGVTMAGRREKLEPPPPIVREQRALELSGAQGRQVWWSRLSRGPSHPRAERRVWLFLCAER